MLILLLALIAAPVRAGSPDGGMASAADAGTPAAAGAADAGQDDEALRRELEKALGKDAAAAGQAAAQPAQAPASTTGGAAPPVPLFRGSQSLNPDISAILDAEGGYQRRPLLFVNGDDPVL